MRSSAHTRVYQALAETDLAISVPLARTLRLIDHVGVPDTRRTLPGGETDASGERASARTADVGAVPE